MVQSFKSMHQQQKLMRKNSSGNWQYVTARSAHRHGRLKCQSGTWHATRYCWKIWPWRPQWSWGKIFEQQINYQLLTPSYKTISEGFTHRYHQMANIRTKSTTSVVGKDGNHQSWQWGWSLEPIVGLTMNFWSESIRSNSVKRHHKSFI